MTIRKSQRPSSEAGVPGDLHTPSLTPKATLTLLHLGRAFDGAHGHMVDLKRASRRFPGERPKTSEGAGLSLRRSKTAVGGAVNIWECKEHLVILLQFKNIFPIRYSEHARRE